MYQQKCAVNRENMKIWLEKIQFTVKIFANQNSEAQSNTNLIVRTVYYYYAERFMLFSDNNLNQWSVVIILVSCWYKPKTWIVVLYTCCINFEETEKGITILWYRVSNTPRDGARQKAAIFGYVTRIRCGPIKAQTFWNINTNVFLSIKSLEKWCYKIYLSSSICRDFYHDSKSI